MTARDLARMANQIAANFAAYLPPGEAAERTAGHLRRFWPPEMRRQLCRDVEAAALDPVALHARDLLEQPVA